MILIVFILLNLGIGFGGDILTSSVDKDFNPDIGDYGKVTITQNDDTLKEIILEENTDQCLTLPNCYAILNVTISEEEDEFFDSIRFVDIIGHNKDINYSYDKKN